MSLFDDPQRTLPRFGDVKTVIPEWTGPNRWSTILIHRVLKFHKCSRHFLTRWKKLWRIGNVTFTFSVMEKVTFTSTDLGSLKRHWLYSSFRLVIIRNKSTHVVNMSWERILPWKIYTNLQSNFFSFNLVISISWPMKNHSNITLVLHFCEIA